jgi:4-amino-4-deoxy-L-arabinose transferase-like glycosyltransferase
MDRTKMAKPLGLKTKLLLLVIFFLAVFLRFYKISTLPQGFDGDEAAFGYYGFSILSGGTDEYGNKFPLYFPSIGDYKYPVYSYLTTIPVAFFGLNVFSTRFLSALSGSILVFVVYFLSRELFDKKEISIFSAILVAVSPYGIFFSRKAFESNVAMVFVATGFLLLLKYLKKPEKKTLFYSVLFFIISLFTYSAARFFLIIFLPVCFFILLPAKRKIRFALFATSLLVVTVSLVSFIDPRGRVRANDVGFLQDPVPQRYLSESIHEDGLAYQGKYILLTRFFHNKVTAIALSVGKRYLQHFDPVYLFYEGNPNMPKYSVPNVGLLYFFEFITVIAGIYGLAKVNSKGAKILGAWILISAVPSSLTIETPNPVRTLLVLPGLIMLSAVGIWVLISSAPQRFKKVLYIIFIFILSFHLYYFWHQYSIHDYYHMPWYSDEKVLEMVSAVNSLKDNYEKVVLPDDSYIHFLFVQKTLPKDFQANSNIESEVLGKWERVDSFGNLIFKMPVDCPKIGRLNVLYVCKGEEIPQNSMLRKIVRYADGVPAYLLIEFVPYSQRKVVDLPSGVHYMVETDLSFKEGLLSADTARYW